MRVAALCPGPSLPEVVPAADVVIAVNRAAVRGCDWLAAHDAPMVDEYRAQATSGTVSRELAKAMGLMRPDPRR